MSIGLLTITFTAELIVDFVISFFIYVVIGVFINYLTRKSGFLFLSIFFFILKLLAVIFELPILSSIVDIMSVALVAPFLTIYLSDVQKLFARRIRKKSLYSQISNDDKQKFIDILNETVLSLAKSKTGAIMTIELSDSLEDYIKKGKKVDAPVSQQVLETIFYEGTPLHDGAVIIRGNMIESAACFYTPTSRGLNGSYGARHRAALGISEVSDALTIVVSEETGRISFTYKGELISSTMDDFKGQLSDYLN